ncbi:spore germination protein [Paenibacillus eucommiae]|uniref:Spore germination protein KA n=1 Tax=Paenibacillus eucommiae TaxID=1355755 RepID=A0ABS4IQZ7_9BACL|nr:spore germination protein [Paenibacillus eucommiae]MBP1989994.1 spore germination protein KA [Paenibacillus eucommiae]
MSFFRKLMKLSVNQRSSTVVNASADPNPHLVLLSSSLDANIAVLQSIYEDCSDVVIHPFLIGGKTNAVLVYIEGLSNLEIIDQHVLLPLMNENFEEDHIHFTEKLTVSQKLVVTTISELIAQISIGYPVILVDNESTGTALGLAKWDKRSIEEPAAESVIRGPREGFTETMTVNTSMLRRRLKSPQFKTKLIKIGRYTQTKVIIAYMEGLAEPGLIEEVTKRVSRIEIDGVLESGYIEELIEDNPLSPFPQLSTTERPDVAASSLLEGRVVILVEGSPFTLIAPTTLFALLQSPEDYYQRFIIGSAIRWLRYLFLGISLLAPSLYVAIVTFHQEMIPTHLLLTLAKSREEIPFPALVEALLMEVTFEALREAGVRLPKQVGAAVSIVGALVIGQAATAAGLVSAPMVMVVAITGIASFMIPHYSAGISFRLLRFPLMILAGMLGLLGIMMGIIVIYIHLCSLRSFGIPYLSPLAPMKGRDWKDVLLRVPWWMMDSRPSPVGKRNPYRQPPGQKPGTNRGNEDM